MFQWLMQNWAQLLVGFLAIETVIARLFPNVGFLQTAEKDLQAVIQATGANQPPKS